MSVNLVILLGRLGKDPEMRYTNQQLPICTFSIATSERRKDQSGNWGDHTEWHNIISFGKLAETCSQYLKKGREVYIEGRIQTRKWQDKEGKDRYTTDIIARNVRFVGSKGTGSSQAATPIASASEMQAAVGMDIPDSGSTGIAETGSADEVSFDDDDIPF